MKLRLLLVLGLLTLLLGITPAEAQSSTEMTTVAGTGGPEGTSVIAPSDVVVDPDGNLYIADTYQQRVLKIDTDGTAATVAGGIQGPGADQLDFPRGIALDVSGNLYIADTENHRIQKVDTNGTVTTVAGGADRGNGPDQLWTPSDLAVDATGNLFIADTDNQRVQKIAPDGTVTTVAGIGGPPGTEISLTYGVAVDADGNLFVADTFNHRVQKIAADGTVTTVAGGNGAGVGTDQLQYPVGVEIDHRGNVYIADAQNQRIQKVDTAGNVTTVAGGNGPGRAADQLHTPYDLSIDLDGHLYVADNTNNRIQSTQLDLVDPTITATTATTADEGDPLTAAFTCADEGPSGLATCVATLDGTAIDNGDPISTTPGIKTLIVTATDNAGNTTTNTMVITVSAFGPRELTGSYAAMTGIEGSVARLYMAVFLRQPDAPGHAYWVKRANDGMTLFDMAEFFITSPEFADTYDELEHPGFVDLLYRNVMNRGGDTEGKTFWTGQLNDGARRAWVTLFFSESPEFKVLTKTS